MAAARELRWFFGATGAATAALHGVLALRGWPFSLDPGSWGTALYALGLAAPALVALAACARPEGVGVGPFLRARLRPRAPGRLYAAALLAQAGFLAAAFGLAALAGREVSAEPSLAPGFALLAVGQLWVVLGEELGWRGYALPRLEALLSPRRATLLLALVWGLWHAPMFWVPGSLQQREPAWLFAAAIFAWSCVHTALYDRAGGSLVPNLVYHAATNLTLNAVRVPGELHGPLALAYLLGGGLVWWRFVPPGPAVAGRVPRRGSR